LFRPVSITLEGPVGRRTAIHDRLALGLVAGAAYLLAPALWLILASAYGSYLLPDLLIGMQGMMLFWPSDK